MKRSYKKVSKQDAEYVDAECIECGAPSGYECDPDCPDYIEFEKDKS